MPNVYFSEIFTIAAAYQSGFFCMCLEIKATFFTDVLHTQSKEIKVKVC